MRIGPDSPVTKQLGLTVKVGRNIQFLLRILPLVAKIVPATQ